MPDVLHGKIKALAVSTPQGASGRLLRESRLVFNYETEDRNCAIALGMPLRAESYASYNPHPIFAMNLPEGNLRQKIVERYAKQFAKLDSMAMLAIVGHDQIGRLTVADPTAPPSGSGAAGVGLNELLRTHASDELFDYLLDTYLASGVSGVQPKVLVPDADVQAKAGTGWRTTARLSDLIVKTSGAAYPHLTQNEFLCMDAAKRAGIDVPEFHLSDDGSLFVIRRFDRTATGERLGFEDMTVLLDRAYDDFGNYKYAGAYEMIPELIGKHCGPNAVESKQRFFEYFAASCMMRNGDAHMKNFGLLYESPDDPDNKRLSPMYDVVTTSVYDMENLRTGQVTQDRTLALKLNKSKDYPDRKALIAFGHRCNVLKPERVLDRIDAGMTASLQANRDRVPQQFWQRMKREWDMSRLGLESQVKRALINHACAPPASNAEQERRSAALPGLKKTAVGPLLAFAEAAGEAFNRAGGALRAQRASVDWRAVEDAAMRRSIVDDHQSAEDVYQAIAGASPGAVTPEQQASLRERVDAVAADLELEADAQRQPDAGLSP